MRKVILEIEGEVEIKPSTVFPEDFVILEYKENNVKNVYYIKKEWLKEESNGLGVSTTVAETRE